MYAVRLSVLFYWLIQQGVDATLTPSGPTVSVDCGSQQTFTCSVTGAGAVWTTTGLGGITASDTNGLTLSNNSRVTTTDSSGIVQTSTITITGFTAADDGGTVQCVNQADSAVQGMTTVSVVSTTLASATAVMANGDQCTATLTWSEPSDSRVTTSVSCTPSSPQCSSCTSSGCTIGGLTPSTSYTFTVTRNRSGCDAMTAMSSAVMSGGVPSCPTNVSVTDRSSDFSSATITWDQPTNSPPVTSYDVTCNSSCTAMPCTSRSSTCRVLSVSPCEDYSVTVLPMNSCGSITGCTGNVVSVPSQGPPQCGTVGVVQGNDSCPSFNFIPQGSVLPSTVVVSYQLVADPSSARSLNCDYPVDPRACRLVVPEGTYTVRATPRKNCGSPSSTCPSHTVPVPAGCEVEIASPDAVSLGVIVGAVIGGVAAMVIVGVSGWCITILIMSCTCFASLGFLALLKCLCCPCCKGTARKSSSKHRHMRNESTVTLTNPPADEYADPQSSRDRKEKDRDKIQYADLEFYSRGTIHQKEQPVIYTDIHQYY